MSVEVLDFDAFRSAVARLPADGLTSQRQRAAAQFTKRGFPTQRDEEWRYTNLGPAATISNDWLRHDSQPGPPAPATASPAADTGIDADWIVISDGIVDARGLASLAPTAGSLGLCRLADQGDAPELFVDDPLASFNAALLRDGIHIRVAEGASLHRPVGILLIDHSNGGPTLAPARIVIEMGAGSTAAFVELGQSYGDAAHFSTSVVELILGDGATTEYLRLQERADGHLHVGQLRARLGAGARLRHGAVDVGGGLVRNDVRIDLNGHRADTTLAGVYLSDGRQHLDNHLFVDHATGPATSRQDYRGIAAGRARCVFNGKVIVRPGANGTDAEQSNHNLLLSDHAEIDTKPELEIYADEVKCSHGATVGQLDDKSLFYLRSRGLGLEDARRLLIHAFVASIIGDLPVPGARQYVDRMLARKLGSMIGGGDS